MNKTDAQNPAVIKLTAESQYWFEDSQKLENALADSQERHADLFELYKEVKTQAEAGHRRLHLVAELHRVSDKVGFRPRMNPGAVTDNAIEELIADAKRYIEVVGLSDVSAAVGFVRPPKKATKGDWEEYAAQLENAIRELRAKYNRNGKR